ncbi:MAG: hypothetical protein Tsb0015_10900 [Simkaniaceae bacterium]
MLQKIWITGFFALINLTFLFAGQEQISSLQEIAEELTSCDENSLIIFDVDEVLITTKDHFGHPYAGKVFSALMHEEMKKCISLEERAALENIWSLSTLQPKRILIEEDAPKLIEELQRQGIKVIALTCCGTGSFGIIPKLERWRIEHLNDLNISFSGSFPNLKRHSLRDIKKSKRAAPLFEEGVLFSEGYDKGDVLKAFLEYNDLHPSKVVFIPVTAT